MCRTNGRQLGFRRLCCTQAREAWGELWLAVQSSFQHCACRACAHQFMKGSMFLRNTLRPLGLLPLVYLRRAGAMGGVAGSEAAQVCAAVAAAVLHRGGAGQRQSRAAFGKLERVESTRADGVLAQHTPIARSQLPTSRNPANDQTARTHDFHRRMAVLGWPGLQLEKPINAQTKSWSCTHQKRMVSSPSTSPSYRTFTMSGKSLSRRESS